MEFIKIKRKNLYWKLYYHIELIKKINIYWIEFIDIWVNQVGASRSLCGERIRELIKEKGKPKIPFWSLPPNPNKAYPYSLHSRSCQSHWGERKGESRDQMLTNFLSLFLEGRSFLCEIFPFFSSSSSLSLFFYLGALSSPCPCGPGEVRLRGLRVLWSADGSRPDG